MNNNSNFPYRLYSEMVDTLSDSEIRQIAGAVNALINKGERVFNLTIGDFNPKIFPVPEKFVEEVHKAYLEGHTNYPPVNGEPALQETISEYLKHRGNLDYKTDDILISCGGRPLIYAVYQTFVNPGETILYPVPSWNNNYYVHLCRANEITIETKPEDNFMPSAASLEPHLSKAAIVALCSPLNPTGTVLTKESIADICNIILDENKRRQAKNIKPLYILFDQIYWLLTHGDTKHHSPVIVNPEIRKYMVVCDGMSKAFAGTGVRVGWAFSEKSTIDKMKAVLSHIGAFPPKPEQVAAAKFLSNHNEVDKFLDNFKSQIKQRLDGFYSAFMKLKSQGFKVNAIAPQAAIYLTVEIDILGKIKPDGSKINDTKDATKYLLDEAKIGLVPFTAFGSFENPTWYRLSVGTCHLSDVEEVEINLFNALSKLK